ncbi:MAG: mycofactocin biosynthesis chaperone MftB [Acidimicrobiales bacterium]
MDGSTVSDQAPRPRFDPSRAWRLHSQVALRDEAFGALAYHYGNRRLVFLRSRTLVDLVRSLESYPSADDALEATVEVSDRCSYSSALANLAASEVIDAR